ncbi:phage portal protein [Nocardia puris]|uniref:SPP1 Gp6-like portal protein n=1 Tax=Nocardia puris TaxID=208602 RepID=A0A366DAR0_9NOCA|nr:phage portal protein [Nocardia puris]RBO87035.1 SPP1 Gp6-like portal protein [Nocardia puris]
MELKPDQGTPDWWFQQLMAGFDRYEPQPWTPPGAPREVRETRRQRFERLWAYYTGRPPLPQVAADYTEVFQAVMRKARCNYAPIPVRALRDRMVLVGASTDQDSDVGGDDLAAEIAEVSNLQVQVQDLLGFLFAMSEAYALVVPSAPGSDSRPMITALDPRNAIGVPNPANPNILRAAMVRSVDELLGTETAHLFLPGWRYTAKRSLHPNGVVHLAKWEWEGEPEQVVGIDDLGGIPVIQFLNENGLGEFEEHIDLLDRINDTTLQRIVLTWYQSFRQMAVIGDLEGDSDEESDLPEVDDEFWADMFRRDPGAMWRVPEGVKFWESAPTDLTGILNAKRDDVKEFGVLTSTPLHMFAPDSANQTAEGATLTREGIEFKVRDRRARVEPGLKMLLRMAFAMAGQAARGAGLKLQWGVLENNSLADRGSATAQSRGVLSTRSQLIRIWGMKPEEAEQNIIELNAERLLTLATNSPTSPPAPGEPGDGSEPGDDDEPGDGSGAAA